MSYARYGLQLFDLSGEDGKFQAVTLRNSFIVFSYLRG